MIELASVIRPGDGLIWGQACAEPQTLVEALVEQRAALSGCSVFLGSSYSGLVIPQHADHLRLASYCGTGTNRALADAGVLEILPVPYSQLGRLIRSGKIKCDIVLVQVSPANARGEYCLGLAVEYLAPALETARAVIAEVNDQVPWTYTEPLLHKKDFALMVQSSRPPVYLRSDDPDDRDLAIARHAVKFVPERATLECGIGSLPNAVLAALAERSDLGYHSGVIPEAAAQINFHACIRGALMGTQLLFDWAREIPAERLRSSD